MPSSLLRACPVPGCGALVVRGRCPEHQRGSSAERLYDARWRAAAKAFRRTHPLCVVCAQEDRVSPAYAVDHIIPHRGDARLFWDRTNWQSLCRSHHNAKASRERA